MRKILIITVFISLLSLPSWSETFTFNDLVTRNNLYYKKFSDIPFTVEISSKESGTFKKGKKDGKWIIYHNFISEDGRKSLRQLIEKDNFKDGRPDGFWEFINKDSSLTIEEKWRNGHLRERITFKDGILDGVWENYWDYGQLKSKYNYKDGERDGIGEGYYTTGKLFYKVTYKRGKKDGLMEYYSPNGKVVFRGTFKRGKENGLLHYYTRDGVFQKTESWKNGIKQFEYYTNDEIFE